MPLMTFERDGDLLKIEIAKQEGGTDILYVERHIGAELIQLILKHGRPTPDPVILPASFV